MKKQQSRETPEKQTTVVSVVEFRSAVSSIVSAANIAAEALRNGDTDERDRGRSVITHCAAGLAALAFAQIPREERR